MSNEKPVELTEAECDSLIVFDTGIYACAAEGYCSGYDHSQPGHDHEDIYDAVARIKAAARREAEDDPKHARMYRALLERAENAEAKVARVEALATTETRYEPTPDDTVQFEAGWNLGYVVAQHAVLTALAEPERDEEGGR